MVVWKQRMALSSWILGGCMEVWTIFNLSMILKATVTSLMSSGLVDW